MSRRPKPADARSSNRLVNFGKNNGTRALIGMVHSAALPGSPRSTQSVASIAAQAAAEARVLVDSGFDAVMIENMHDAPYVHAGPDRRHPPETVAAMTACLLEIRRTLGERVPIGVQVLSGGAQEALAVALAGGGDFIRCENFVFAHVGDEGLMPTAEAGPLLRYRRSIGAEGIPIFCDIKKKHASHAITADLSIADAVEGAEFFGADGVIITGSATGKPTSLDDIREARAATDLPVFVGSGVTPQTVAQLFDAGANALIVGSSIKRGGSWVNPVDPARARAMARARR